MTNMEKNHQTYPNYTFLLPFEKSFEPIHTLEWMGKQWHTSLYIGAVYLIAIFGGRALMSNRAPFKLKKPLLIWNISLALFSIFGALRTLPEMFHVLRHYGLGHSVCDLSFILEVRPSGFWTWMFILSKIVELGDTAFIVLRKQKLMLLHWYHHASVLAFSWYAYGHQTAAVRWYTDMNLVVHSVMYSYYALRALGVRLPKQLAILITTSQILQMIVGAYVCSYAYYTKLQGAPCATSKMQTFLGLTMYFSYLVLFVQFFYATYLSPSDKKGQVKATENGASAKKKVALKRD